MSFRETLSLLCDKCPNRFAGREGESLTEVRQRAWAESWQTNYGFIPATDYCAQCQSSPRAAAHINGRSEE